MSQNITAWTDPRSPAIDEVVPFVSIAWREDGRVVMSARDKAGRQVDVVVPGFAWLQMAKEISWNAPRRMASLMARRTGGTPDLPSAG